jgi:hypothetical protein
MTETENTMTPIVQLSQQLIRVGPKFIAPDGFSVATAVQLLDTGEKVTVKDWSDCFGNGGNSRHGRRKSRNQIRSVRNHLRLKGMFVVGYYAKKYGLDGRVLPIGELKAIRLYRPGGDAKQQHAIAEQIDKLEAQRDRLLSEEEFAKQHIAHSEAPATEQP